MKVIWSIELVLLALLTLIQPLQAKDWSKDPQAAVQLAAEQGDADAQFALGGMYYGGEGGPQDYLQAYAWLSVAAANGAVDAVKHRDILAQKLSQTQFAEAQVLATRYFEHSRPK